MGNFTSTFCYLFFSFCNMFFVLNLFCFSDGLRYIKPFLLEGRSRDVRQSFSQLLEHALSAHTKHRGPAAPITAILVHLVEMLGSEVHIVLLIRSHALSPFQRCRTM